MNPIRKYEETDKVERDVMQSLGYEWKNRGWQRGSQINQDTILTQAWVGPVPNNFKPPKNPERPHIWDTPISEINKSTTNIFDDDDPPAPLTESYKNEERKKKDDIVKYHKELEQDINYKLQTATQIKQSLQTEYNKKVASLSPAEKAEHELNIAKTALEQTKAQIALDMAKVKRIEAEYSRLAEEAMILSYEKPTSSNRREWKKAWDTAHKKLEEANPIKNKIENDKKNLPKLEKDIQNKKQNLDNEKQNEIKDAVKFTADFYKEVTSKYGEQSAKIAKELAEAAKGKQIRNAEQALKSFDKYKESLNKKFGVKDREAIAKALESLKRDEIAKNLKKFSKAFGLTSSFIDFHDLLQELKKSIETNNWQPFFIKTESLVAGKAAVAITAFSFSIILGSPIGALGYALIIAVVGALINDELIEKANKLL
ncbi:colicin-like pore-forming protein (plasmid) [Arsenophonus nasoniae]|nr:colicin-like pore-forming protein [Arsenophonus nasoniae]QBY46646.1 Colicin-Ia [Arsenophonus nasoniae]WGM08324.1 colicin-like pore-forming protein [Arsenophonus nasoniae]WGM13189.1 colicin-like pore-forming protein [Arsenophonus nasoniae]WGM17891.1 colicin-like pore-forming protein [Arsenophonus nasoniae]